MAKKTLLLGHSPDPDDAFMFFALARNRVHSDNWEFEHVLQDIQTLNERALRGELDITAISIHAYPYLQDRYALLNCGSSMGDGYGPMVVSRRPRSVSELQGAHILVPGEWTTAFLALNLLVGRGRFTHTVTMFDRIIDELGEGRADAGLLIHEGQLTYARQQLHLVVDLGQWWHQHSGLPLPLGGNAIRRDLGEPAIREIAGLLKASIEYGLHHRDEALQYALQYGRDLDGPLTDRFVAMYVNDWTLDYGDTGRRAVRELLEQGHRAGLVPPCPHIDFF